MQILILAILELKIKSGINEKSFCSFSTLVLSKYKSEELNIAIYLLSNDQLMASI